MTSEDWVHELSLVLAKRRTGGSVYMDGRHNPLPTEIQEARRFLGAYDAWWLESVDA